MTPSNDSLICFSNKNGVVGNGIQKRTRKKLFEICWNLLQTKQYLATIINSEIAGHRKIKVLKVLKIFFLMFILTGTIRTSNCMILRKTNDKFDQR